LLDRIENHPEDIVLFPEAAASGPWLDINKGTRLYGTKNEDFADEPFTRQIDGKSLTGC